MALRASPERRFRRGLGGTEGAVGRQGASIAVCASRAQWRGVAVKQGSADTGHEASTEYGASARAQRPSGSCGLATHPPSQLLLGLARCVGAAVHGLSGLGSLSQGSSVQGCAATFIQTPVCMARRTPGARSAQGRPHTMRQGCRIDVGCMGGCSGPNEPIRGSSVGAESGACPDSASPDRSRVRSIRGLSVRGQENLATCPWASDLVT